MPVVAQGCIGHRSRANRDRRCSARPPCATSATARAGPTRRRRPRSMPSQVAPRPDQALLHLHPARRRRQSRRSIDDGVGHAMGGAQIAANGCRPAVDVFVQPTPIQTAKISVFVFQDDYPLNGEADTGGGVDVLAPNEPGLGGFNIVLLDQAGGFGDSAGQLTYDMFGMPVSNALAGTDRPGHRATTPARSRRTSTDGLVGMIVDLPEIRAIATARRRRAVAAGRARRHRQHVPRPVRGAWRRRAPTASRAARNGCRPTRSTAPRPSRRSSSPASRPTSRSSGPAATTSRSASRTRRSSRRARPRVCAARQAAAPANFYGKVTTTRMSRTPDQRVYSSGSYDSYSFAQCYVSLGVSGQRRFRLRQVRRRTASSSSPAFPTGNLKVTVFDQWNDLLVDGLSTPIKVDGAAATGSSDRATAWKFRSRSGAPTSTAAYSSTRTATACRRMSEPGLPLVPYNIRYRDGSYFGFNNTDLAGYAGFNEVFPFLNWLVVDIDSARYKLTGVHVVYDAGGPVDGTHGRRRLRRSPQVHGEHASSRPPPICRRHLRVPGARYCADADCPAGLDTAGRLDRPRRPGLGCRRRAGRACSATTASSNSP